jgi:hypothetical protein
MLEALLIGWVVGYLSCETKIPKVTPALIGQPGTRARQSPSYLGGSGTLWIY